MVDADQSIKPHSSRSRSCWSNRFFDILTIRTLVRSSGAPKGATIVAGMLGAPGTGRSMKSASLAAMFSICLAFAAAANAPLAQSDSPSEPERRAENPPPPSYTDQEAPPADNNTAPTTNPASICQLLESAAAANGLPFEFFAQVIWRESRFRSDIVGPVTRTGHRAQGIAQFMPATAAERLLHDPFDPFQALPKSAEFLRELRAQFGNLGLAAAAYNAGPQRVRDWLAGKRTLPSETQTYVRNVTGRSAQEWTRPDQKSLTLATPGEMPCAKQ